MTEPTDLTEGATEGEKERMRSLSDNDVKSVSSVSPWWALLVGKQIRTVDGVTCRCVSSAQLRNCAQNQIKKHIMPCGKEGNHGDKNYSNILVYFCCMMCLS